MEADQVTIKVKRLPSSEGLPLPAYATPGAAGMDVCAALEKDLQLPPGKAALVPTGLLLELPAGYEVQVRPRSGLALRHGVTLLNSPGTLDSDYRGELQVLVINLGEKTYTIRRGDRIAQLILNRVARGIWVEVEDLGATIRDDGGFGHSGR